jgi:hypothetical protein
VTTFELGVDLCFAIKRWPEPERWAAIVRDELQLRCVEFDSDFLDPFCVPEETRLALAAEVRQCAEAAGLTIHNYFGGLSPHCLNLLAHPDERLQGLGLDWAKGAIRTAATMGAKGTGQHGLATISAQDCLSSERYGRHIDRLVQVFQEMSFYAQECGLEFILLEQMYTPSEPPYTMAQTSDILSRINEDSGVPVKLALDVGHASSPNYPHSLKDADPYAWLRVFGVTRWSSICRDQLRSSQHWPFIADYNARHDRRGRFSKPFGLQCRTRDAHPEVFFSLSQNEEQVLGR